MNIFKFKHLASSENKNKANKIDIKEINGFTFVEVILVMALVSFLYIVTMKVIQHNLDQKVPVYVYNLYKNLDNESKLLTKKLIEEANSSEGGGSGSNSNQKTIDDVLKGMDAKTYCQAFANDANLIGNADCENSIKNIETSKSESKSLTYNCKRTYKFNVYSNGKYKETFTPSYNANLPQCKDNQNFDDDTISCNAKPTQKIADLMLNNTQNYHTYTCGNKSETADNNETKPDVAAFSIDTKPNIQKSLKTTNNVHLNFVTLKPGNNKYSITYNLAAIVTQDEICPKPKDFTFTITPKAEIDKGNTIGSPFCPSRTQKPFGEAGCYINNNNKNFVVINLQYDPTNKKVSFKSNYYFYRSQGDCKGVWNQKFTYQKSVYCRRPDWKYEIKLDSPEFNINLGSTCSNYIDATNILEQTKTTKKTLSNSHQYSKTQTKKETWNISLEKTIIDIDYYKKYYNKWSKFFNNNSSFLKATKAAISSRTKNEGVVTNTLDKNSSTNNYLAHFIYAAIDTSFEKGEMGKNIFVFEQFGSKIIPVGYLANNQNTPLKFDVITRNPETFKIEKVNYKNGMEKRPLTFCEAMKYTGEKFSQYCGCKDANGKIVTQYTKIATCDNKFGCIIRPVQPSSGK